MYQILIDNHMVQIYIINNNSLASSMVHLNSAIFFICLTLLVLLTETHNYKSSYREKDYKTKSWEKQKYNKYKKEYKKFQYADYTQPTSPNSIKKNESAKKIVQAPKKTKTQVIQNKKTEVPKKTTKKPQQQVKKPEKTTNEVKKLPQKQVTVVQTPKPQEIMDASKQEIKTQTKTMVQTLVKEVPIVPVAQQIPHPIEIVPTPPQCMERPIYDYNLLVLTWVPEECYADIDCQKDWQTYDDLRSPTIHSFKPSGSSSYYQSCFSEVGDPFCRQNAYMPNFQIDEALWNVTGLVYQINLYWPALKFTHDEQSFYTHQWLMHGTCYLMNMIEDNPNAYKNDPASFNRTIMIQYFRTAINKFKKLAIEVEPGTEYSQKQTFAEDIGFGGKQTHFALICNSKNEIVQIIFCFNRSKLPGKEVTIPCTLQDTCDETKIFSLKKPL